MTNPFYEIALCSQFINFDRSQALKRKPTPISKNYTFVITIVNLKKLVELPPHQLFTHERLLVAFNGGFSARIKQELSV